MTIIHSALYFFQATDSDELTITEGEELEILEKDSEGWCKVSSNITSYKFCFHEDCIFSIIKF